MKESVYNFYLIADAQERILYLGRIFYELDGTDDAKEAFMREAAERSQTLALPSTTLIEFP